MINSFDAFFLKHIPYPNLNLLKIVTSISDPKLNLIFWGLISLILLPKYKWSIFESKPFYFFCLTCAVMFVCGITKITLGRARPYMLDQDVAGLMFFQVKHDFLSFPSSHTALAIAFTYLASHLFNLHPTCYIYPLGIGLTRLMLREHFATDVLGGLILGLLTSALFVKQLYLLPIIQKFIFLSSSKLPNIFSSSKR